jgi:non-canonical purine NTP pyrophosphatase, rdgB/HAM1 family
MQLTLATKNAGKVREIKKILPEFDIQTMAEAGIELDIEENGETFEENALIKARAIWKVCGGLVIADDSGLEIDYLGGQPGVHSSRFMGEDTDYVIKNRELIHRLEKAKAGERKARFVAVIACILPDGREFTTRGTMEGEIAMEPSGTEGFGYDPILYLPDYGCTSAQISLEEKNKISHRGKALKKMRERLNREGVV